MYHVVSAPPGSAHYPDLFVRPRDFADQMNWLSRRAQTQVPRAGRLLLLPRGQVRREGDRGREARGLPRRDDDELRPRTPARLLHAQPRAHQRLGRSSRLRVEAEESDSIAILRAMSAPKILAVASAADLDFRYGCTPAWWQIWKGLYEAGADLIVTPYRGRAIEPPGWPTAAHAV